MLTAPWPDSGKANRRVSFMQKIALRLIVESIVAKIMVIGYFYFQEPDYRLAPAP